MKKVWIASILATLMLLLILNSTIVNSEPISSSPLEYLNSGVYLVTPPIINYFKYGEFFSSIELLRDWSGKTFTNATFMFIGGGIGYRPNFNITIRICSYYPGNPSKVHVYIDGEFYDTLYPYWPGGPICRRAYDLYYYEKGFHSLSFVAGDNSSRLDIDVLVGFNGFFRNILPYLVPKIL